MNRKARRCCGIDVHKASLSACIRLHGKGRKVSEEIRTFGTTGDELLALHDWLKEHEVTEVDGGDRGLLEAGVLRTGRWLAGDSG
jgi:hypothetical protein